MNTSLTREVTTAASLFDTLKTSKLAQFLFFLKALFQAAASEL